VGWLVSSCWCSIDDKGYVEVAYASDAARQHNLTHHRFRSRPNVWRVIATDMIAQGL